MAFVVYIFLLESLLKWFETEVLLVSTLPSGHPSNNNGVGEVNQERTNQ